MKMPFERHTFVNIGYTTVARMLMYVFSAIASVVLGRCLLASDYGIVSFALVFVSFMDKFSDIGIGSAIIQRKHLDETTLSTAFTLKFIIGCLAAVATFLISTVVPYFFDNPNAVTIIQLMSLCFLFNNVYFLPSSLLVREMNFKTITIVETATGFLNSLIAIVLALNGYGYWSIVLGYIVSNFFSAASLALIKPVTIRFRLDARVAKELVDFGGYLFLAGLLAFLISNIDNFIIGTVKGAKELGYYAVAFNWSAMICLIMNSVVLRVIYPVMAKLQDRKQEMKDSYLKTLEYSAYIIVLANLVLFVISKEFLINVLGRGSDKWLPALAALRILCFYGIIRGLLEPISQVIMALAKTSVLFKANLVAAVLEIAAIYPALKYYGLTGVAFTVTFAYLSQYFIYYHFLKTHLQIRTNDLLKAVRPSVFASIPIVVAYLIFHDNYAVDLSMLLVKMLSIVSVYIVCLGFVTDWEFFRILWHLMHKQERVG